MRVSVGPYNNAVAVMAGTSAKPKTADERVFKDQL